LSKAVPLTETACIGIMYRLATKANTRRQKQSKYRYNIQGAHGFRKRFNTILKSNNEINSNLAERMMGHSQTIRLDNSYLDPSIDRLFEEYLKAIPELSIDDSIRLRLKTQIQEKRITELESSKDGVIAGLRQENEKFKLELLRQLEIKLNR